MNVKLRPGLPDDAEVCGRICYEAFGAVSGTHGFPNDFPSAEVASGLLGVLLGHPGFYSVVAEVDGRVMGNNFAVRPATTEDIAACDALCRRVHGHHRHGEVVDAVRQNSALVVEHDGRISGYSTGLAFFAHTVGETNEDLKALIGAASEFAGPGILVPAANSELFEWCMDRGLKMVQLMTLMTIGLYNEPAGSYLPSVLY
jgi:hypothetical protein